VDRARMIRPFVRDAGLTTMLDIGGSTGVVAGHFAKEFALDGTLIDPAPLEVEQARQFGLETITGLVEEHDFGTRRFDFVIICQTIDHLLDVSGTLRRVHDLLTDRGLLFVDIVDFRAAYLRGWSVEDATKIDHPYYLTQNSMEAYLRRAGFAIAAIDYAADHLHVSYLCRRGTPAPEALPDPQAVRDLFREIRFVQNAPRPS
jgi:SAM-dependent methyltransferase